MQHRSVYIAVRPVLIGGDDVISNGWGDCEEINDEKKECAS